MDDKTTGTTSKEISFDLEDEYLRKPIAEKVISLLTSDIDVSPMVIDGSWGAGKTRFCRKLITLFKETNPEYRCIYVDAFKADHADEPLMTLLAAVAEELPARKREALIKKAIPAARFALKTGLKAGIGWVLRQDAVELGETFEQEVQKAGEEAVNLAVESLIKDHIEANRSIATLRSALENLAKDNPIVIFVDELDRCRPNFAINMLENIKHVFDVQGVQFVLVTNTEQLRASVNHTYGLSIDAQRYLDKFVAFSFSLADTYSRDGYNITNSAAQHFSNLVKNSAILADSGLVEGVMEFAQELIIANRLSLRETETFVKYLEIYQVISDNRALAKNIIFGYRFLRVLATFIFCFFPDLRSEIKRGIYDADKLMRVLGEVQIVDILESHPNRYTGLIAAIVALEATDNADKYQFEEDEERRSARKQQLRQSFTRGYGYRDGRLLETVAETIRELEFGVVTG